MIKKVKKNWKTVPWIYVISDLNEEEIVGTLYEKELKKQKSSSTIIYSWKSNKKGNTLYVKWSYMLYVKLLTVGLMKKT